MLEFTPQSLLQGTVIVTISGYGGGVYGRDQYGNWIPQADQSYSDFELNIGVYIGSSLSEGEVPPDLTTFVTYGDIYAYEFIVSGEVPVTSTSDQSLYVINQRVPGDVFPGYADPFQPSVLMTRRAITVLSVAVDASVAQPLSTRPGTRRGHFT